MALTLTELMVVPGTGDKRMSIWKVTGDGSSYQVNVADLKMSKVQAAWTENLNASYKIPIYIGNYDYVDGMVSIIELGDGGNVLENGKEHLLVVIGY